jgi:hypothetical protein
MSGRNIRQTTLRQRPIIQQTPIRRPIRPFERRTINQLRNRRGRFIRSRTIQSLNTPNNSPERPVRLRLVFGSLPVLNSTPEVTPVHNSNSVINTPVLTTSNPILPEIIPLQSLTPLLFVFPSFDDIISPMMRSLEINELNDMSDYIL